MAREPRRRSFSRRTQYTLFAGYVIAAVGVVVGLALVVIQRVAPSAFSAIEGVVLDATAPVGLAGRSVARGFDGVVTDVSGYVFAGSQNATLKAELAVARQKLIRARALEHENRRLKALARLATTEPLPIATARIIGSSGTGQRRYATLAAGSRDGVRPGMPVRSSDGLVGLVSLSGRFAARVLLLTDAASSVPVLVARTGLPALAVGRGDGTLDARAIVGGGTPFRKGDLLVTSGTGGIYPPNIPVALVTTVDRDVAVARPLADPAALDFAVVTRPFGPIMILPPTIPQVEDGR
ncbi:rod shape-determining protein MreC [Sphingomonas naphthae]|uniref:Cell shape-determining protein MreC n=1 Tax=Sphingomonas naphthae TaxID=1813468 RepID=A0ABY7TJI7_9SPHN|nr:rod shape-determining protein MreC [Sphingomonas naphthae]WCT73324.1 rod shape-determining protein MreC [Sphingomonas naphthae]